jgi:hypothetical protein
MVLAPRNKENKMKRKDQFHSYKNHPWLCRVFKKLTKADVLFCETYLAENDHLTKDDFQLKVNRLFMDDRNPPKAWKEIKELLTCTNSALNQGA